MSPENFSAICFFNKYGQLRGHGLVVRIASGYKSKRIPGNKFFYDNFIFLFMMGKVIHDKDAFLVGIDGVQLGHCFIGEIKNANNSIKPETLYLSHQEIIF
jgi:hypothetical protein